MRGPSRFYLAYAPAGVWSSGPSVIPAGEPDPESFYGDLLEIYRNMGWDVEGPFKLEDTHRPTEKSDMPAGGESRREYRARINGNAGKD